MITLSKHELSALLKHASDDETRTHLACVHLDDDLGLAVATDGHRLAVLSRAPLGSNGIEAAQRSKSGVDVSRASLATVIKLCPAGGSAELSFGERLSPKVSPDVRAQVLDKKGSHVSVPIPLSLVSVAFPPFSQVIPAHAFDPPGEHVNGRDYGPRKATRKGATRWGINVDYLAEAADFCASNQLEGKKTIGRGCICIAPEDDLSPMVFRSSCGHKLAVVMPMRLD